MFSFFGTSSNHQSFFSFAFFSLIFSINIPKSFNILNIFRGGHTQGEYRPVIHYRDLDAPREPEEFI